MDSAAASEGGLAPAGLTQTFAGAAASESSLAAVLPAGGTQTNGVLGPCLFVGMGEASMVERMNAWGATRDQELLDLRSNLVATQVVVSTTFDQAKATLLAIVVDFRTEAETMRQHGQYEATQSVARLEHVVAEARQRFDAQEVRFTQDLGELVRRQQAVEAWAQAEPTRVAAIVQAAPAPPWMQTSPGGTPLTFYPSPGPVGPMLPPVPTTPPLRTAQPAATPAWDAWAAGRAAQNPAAAAPMPDAWAASRAAATAQESPGVPRHFDMSTPGGGVGRGAYPREMRIDARLGRPPQARRRRTRASKSGRTAPWGS